MPVALPSLVRSSISFTRNSGVGQKVLPRFEVQAREGEAFVSFVKDELRRLYTLLEEGQSELASRVGADEVLSLASRYGEDFIHGDYRHYFALADYLRRRAQHVSESEREWLLEVAERVASLSPLGAFALADLMGRLARVPQRRFLEELAPVFARRRDQGAGVTGT